MAIKNNLVIDQGSDYSVIINVETSNNMPASLSGYTAQSQIRKNYTSLTAYSFGTVVNSALRIVTLSLSSNTTDTIPGGRYVYDCEITSNTGIKTRLVEGIVTITPQVTK